ncbi:sialidase family protein [Isosphaeraceae bacterium EP7]
MRWIVPGLVAALLLASPVAKGEEPAFSTSILFPFEKKHNHASCVVELADGSLLATWYTGSGERKSDDVRIVGARLKKGATAWGPVFEMADTPGYPDCNPSVFVGQDKALWLFWPTILDHRWEGALLKFARAEDGTGEGTPRWTREGVIHITPVKFEDDIQSSLKTVTAEERAKHKAEVDELESRAKDLIYQRLGWMPRVRPIVLPSGRWLLPLYTDTYSMSLVAISDDQGATWQTSRPMIGFGNIQPSLVRKKDGTIVAFMRENGPRQKIRLSTSKDEGQTWSVVTESSLPNPGAGVDAILLASGAWAIIYNDLTDGRHSLAISLSDDEGATWPITRHVESHAKKDGSYHYPSILQDSDGAIHVTYTNGGKPEGSTIQHARLNEAWIRQGDPTPKR